MADPSTPTLPQTGEETACELLARERSRCVKPCDVCEGEGEIADGLDEAACSMPCPRCDGNAWLVDLGRLSALGPPPTEVREDWTSADEEALHARARSLLKVAGEEMLAIEPNPSIWVSQNSALRAIIRLIEPERRATPPMRNREAIARKLYSYSPHIHSGATEAMPPGTLVMATWEQCHPIVRDGYLGRADEILEFVSGSPSPCDCLVREALAKGPSNERIIECKRAFAYKYFGDYEMSEDQRAAVDDAETAMDALLAARTALQGQTGGEGK